MPGQPPPAAALAAAAAAAAVRPECCEVTAGEAVFPAAHEVGVTAVAVVIPPAPFTGKVLDLLGVNHY